MENNYELLSYASVSKQLNNRVYTNYYYRLMLIAKALFKWEGLPNGINEKWIENYLYSEGGCIFFKDENYKSTIDEIKQIVIEKVVFFHNSHQTEFAILTNYS